MFMLLAMLSVGLHVALASAQDSVHRVNEENAGDQRPKTNVAAMTPEQVVRTFMMATLTKDEKTLRAVTVPTKDFDWLLRGKDVPAEELKNAKAQITEMRIRTLKPGDEITLPGNRKYVVQRHEAVDDHAVLWPEGAPLPFRLQKIDGRWQVNASSVIAVRKAAQAERK